MNGAAGASQRVKPTQIMTHASTPPSAKLNFLRIIIFTVRLRQTGILTPSKPHWQAVVPFEYIRVQFGIDSYIHRSKSSN